MSEGCHKRPLTECQNETKHYPKIHMRGGPIIGAHSKYIFDHFCSSVGASVTNDALQMR